jgi:hypothetical protein
LQAKLDLAKAQVLKGPKRTRALGKR